MPTNVTRPVWQCDTCRHRFGVNLAAAQRCEQAPPADPLPPGTLMLDYDRGYHLNSGGFVLNRLFPLPTDQWQGTLVNEHRTGDQPNGHFAYYLLNIDPTPHIDQAGVLRVPYGSLDCNGKQVQGEPKRLQGNWLWPHRPGLLQLSQTGHIGGGTGYTRHRGDGLAWITGGLLGMDNPAGAPEAEVGERWVRPLTEPVKAVLEALGAQVQAASPCTVRGWKYFGELGAVAGERFRTPTGKVIREAAKLWLRTRPADEVARTVNLRWSMWLEGRPGDVPMPRLRTPRGRDGRKLTYSKLTKDLKKLVAATGVDWPERRDADDYCRRLLDEALGYTVSTTDNLFPTVPNIVAVGGGKGGVGKSTVAAALARRLAGDGFTVTLVDCDVTGPSQHLLHDLDGVQTDVAAGTVLPSPTGVDRLTVISSGQLFRPADVRGWSPQTMGDWMRFMGTCVDVAAADVVVLDLPPGENTIHEVVYDNVHVALTATVHVTTGHPLALSDTARSLAVIDGNHHRQLRSNAARHIVVENMSRAVGLTATGEQAEVRLQGQASAAVALAAEHGIGFGGSLPWLPDLDELAASTEIGAIAGMLPLTLKI